MKKKFKSSDLLDNGLPYEGTESNVLAWHGRWSVGHEIVFEWEGKFWKAEYSEAATESQDEGPWEYQKEVECTEVELKEVTELKWVVKDEHV